MVKSIDFQFQTIEYDLLFTDPSLRNATGSQSRSQVAEINQSYVFSKLVQPNLQIEIKE